MTSHTSEDGFHEIQLNGKQLVFLFMAATVVSVVIFLTGVLVGRGVRAERGAEAVAAALAEQPSVDATTATAGDVPSLSDPRTAAPPTGGDDLSYFNRLEKTQPLVEDLKPAPPEKSPALAADARPAVPSAGEPAAVPSRTPPAAKPTASKPTVPATVPASRGATRGAYVVQIAALNSRAEADAMVRQLSTKGYEAYVQPPAQGGPSIFRVRIGNFPTRREAETLAAKIQQEGQFKPWVALR